MTDTPPPKDPTRPGRPAHGVPKVKLDVRISPSGLEWIDKMAEQAGGSVTRSDVLRACTKVAYAHAGELRTLLAQAVEVKG